MIFSCGLELYFLILSNNGSRSFNIVNISSGSFLKYSFIISSSISIFFACAHERLNLSLLYRPNIRIVFALSCYQDHRPVRSTRISTSRAQIVWIRAKCRGLIQQVWLSRRFFSLRNLRPGQSVVFLPQNDRCLIMRAH